MEKTFLEAADMDKETELQAKAARILEEAKARGLQNDFFFSTTLDRYMEQLKILERLKKQIHAKGLTVTKQYAKGAKNVYANPLIGEYNKTASAANGTVTTLLNVLRSLDGEESPGGGKLQTLMASLADDEE